MKWNPNKKTGQPIGCPAFFTIKDVKEKSGKINIQMVQIVRNIEILAIQITINLKIRIIQTKKILSTEQTEHNKVMQMVNMYII